MEKAIDHLIETSHWLSDGIRVKQDDLIQIADNIGRPSSVLTLNCYRSI